MTVAASHLRHTKIRYYLLSSDAQISSRNGRLVLFHVRQLQSPLRALAIDIAQAPRRGGGRYTGSIDLRTAQSWACALRNRNIVRIADRRRRHRDGMARVRRRFGGVNASGCPAWMTAPCFGVKHAVMRGSPCARHDGSRNVAKRNWCILKARFWRAAGNEACMHGAYRPAECCR